LPPAAEKIVSSKWGSIVNKTTVLGLFCTLILPVAFFLACNHARQTALARDGATFDPDGTAHITRVVPAPSSVSPAAQKWLASLTNQSNTPETLQQRRTGTDEWRKRGSAEARRLYPVNVEETSTAGVRTDIIMPLDSPPANRGRVLINLHGGGFNADSGSLIEGVPICHLAKIKVISVYYRLAPENPFPAAVEDVIAVYKELLNTYKPRNIGIFGTSAGATLTAEVTAQLKQSGIPLPGGLGLFSAHPDYSRVTDSRQLFGLDGLPGATGPSDPNHPPDDPYVGNTNRKDPVLSPLFSDLKSWPPSLLVTSTRDFLLSDTVIFHRALLREGNEAQLVVFEALPHAFWYHFQLPETKEALGIMARFFDDKLGR
jgi:epsilon-lactone hydrolase